MKVIAGKLKGRFISFNNKKYNNADCTSQIVKGALFSSLHEVLEGKSFLDLYACSGQIGIEALSRGARLVVFNELDTEMYYCIKTIIREWDLGDSALLFNLHAFRCLRYLDRNNILFDYIYIDPPYIKVKGEVRLYYNILKELGKYSILKENSQIIIQHFSENRLKDRISSFRIYDTRVYGNNSLSFFRMDFGK